MDTIPFAVNGTLMRGLLLNQNLLNVGATFLCETHTAPLYRLWSIDDRHPAMQRVSTGGAALALELWALPSNHLATILLQEPPGLCLGTIILADGRSVVGVLGEAYLCLGQRDITSWGGWRAYMDLPPTALV